MSDKPKPSEQPKPNEPAKPRPPEPRHGDFERGSFREGVDKGDLVRNTLPPPPPPTR